MRLAQHRDDRRARVGDAHDRVDPLDDEILDVVDLLGDVALAVDDDEILDVGVLLGLLLERGEALGRHELPEKPFAKPILNGPFFAAICLTGPE